MKKIERLNILVLIVILQGCATTSDLGRISKGYLLFRNEIKLQQSQHKRIIEKRLVKNEARTQEFMSLMDENWNDFGKAYKPSLRRELQKNLKTLDQMSRKYKKLLAAIEKDKEITELHVNDSANALNKTRKNSQQSEMANVVVQFKQLQHDFHKLEIRSEIIMNEMQRLTTEAREHSGSSADSARKTVESAQRMESSYDYFDSRDSSNSRDIDDNRQRIKKLESLLKKK